METQKTFIVFTEYGELLDIALALQDQGHEVLFHVSDHNYKNIGKNLVTHCTDWYQYLNKGYLWIFDGCNNGEFQDWLRASGELVFGSSKIADELENNRQKAQIWFKKAGFKQPESHNFKSIQEALAFVKTHKDKQWVLKQNADAPKFINHVGKFKGSEDMIFHLKELEHIWNRQEWGEFDCDLMEKVEGMEVAVSAFFNGHDFLKNKEGKVVAFINFEHKKQLDGDLGSTTGETGTIFIGANEDNQLVKDVLLRPEIIRVLRESKFRGVFDINGSKTKDGYVAFEPTCRPGVPASSYEFVEGLVTPFAEVARIVASGEDTPIEIHEGFGGVLVVYAKPFPIEADLDKEATSQGEKLWILENGEPSKEMTAEQKKHIHLFNFEKITDESKEARLSVATKNGYLLTVTQRGSSIADVRGKLIEYVKNNLYIADIGYRTDLGERIEESSGVTNKQRLEKDYQKKLDELKTKHDEELAKVKKTIKDIIYE